MTGVQTCALPICFPVTIGSEVVNNNLAAEGDIAVIAGKGVGAGNGSFTYTTDEHCVVMCIYHAVPLLDWSLKGHNPQLLCTSVSDFPQPAFDQLGMQPVPSLALNNSPSSPTGNIGYNLRYWQWKSAVDTVHGAFRPAAPIVTGKQIGRAHV